jgi:hypothetical protein
VDIAKNLYRRIQLEERRLVAEDGLGVLAELDEVVR